MEKTAVKFRIGSSQTRQQDCFSAYTLSKAQDIEFISDDLCCKNICKKSL